MNRLCLHPPLHSLHLHPHFHPAHLHSPRSPPPGLPPPRLPPPRLPPTHSLLPCIPPPSASQQVTDLFEGHSALRALLARCCRLYLNADTHVAQTLAQYCSLQQEQTKLEQQSPRAPTTHALATPIFGGQGLLANFGLGGASNGQEEERRAKLQRVRANRAVWRAGQGHGALADWRRCRE